MVLASSGHQALKSGRNQISWRGWKQQQVHIQSIRGLTNQPCSLLITSSENRSRGVPGIEQSPQLVNLEHSVYSTGWCQPSLYKRSILWSICRMLPFLSDRVSIRARKLHQHLFQREQMLHYSRGYTASHCNLERPSSTLLFIGNAQLIIHAHCWRDPSLKFDARTTYLSTNADICHSSGTDRGGLVRVDRTVAACL